jgi:hypothetical protein
MQSRHNKGGKTQLFSADALGFWFNAKNLIVANKTMVFIPTLGT